MIYFVGAGPGDPGLMTVRGMELLRSCEVLVYDRLGTAQLIAEAPPDCERIFVGKQAGRHARTQAQINEILIAQGSREKRVVRLKGGDPYVFGRGGEEAMALAAAGIPYMVVPGVTSAVAVPELCGIPVTHRGNAKSFHVFTGHGAARTGGEDDLSHIRAMEGTSVFLMGLSHLEAIVARLQETGADPRTPAAVISQGTMPGEQVVRSSLREICQNVRQAQLEAPAILVVGENASLDLRTPLGSLQGIRAGIIGTAPLRRRLQTALAQQGARVYGLIDMQVEPTPEKTQLREALQEHGQYQWLAFTSANAVQLFFACLQEWQMDLRCLSGMRFAVVGRGTGEALRRYGFLADYTPPVYTTQALAKGLLKEMAPGETLLLPRAVHGVRPEAAGADMTQILAAGGASFREIPMYRVRGRRMETFSEAARMDVWVFASASGVTAFLEEMENASEQPGAAQRMSGGAEKQPGAAQRMSGGAEKQPGARGLSEEALKHSDPVQGRSKKMRGGLHRPCIAAIGRTTAQALEASGIPVDIVPAQFDVPGLAEAIAAYFSGDRENHSREFK